MAHHFVPTHRGATAAVRRPVGPDLELERPRDLTLLGRVQRESAGIADDGRASTTRGLLACFLLLFIRHCADLPVFHWRGGLGATAQFLEEPLLEYVHPERSEEHTSELQSL